MSIELYGVDKVMAALKKMDPVVDKEVRKELSKAAGEVTTVARSFVDPQGLSGWGAWRGGYNPAVIATGIKTRRGGRRKRGHITSNYIGVANTTAAGAIWETAGRKSSGATPSGVAMIRAITERSGAPSRTVWAAIDETAGGDAVRRIGEALNRAAAVVQAGINRPTKGA